MDEGDLTARLQARARGRCRDLVGIETVSAVPGRVVNRVRLREALLDCNHAVHGGVVSSLGDSCAGSAVRTPGQELETRARRHAAGDLHVSSRAPAHRTELVAEARVVKMGRTGAFTQVGVRDGAGRVVTPGLVTFVIGGRRGPGG